MKSYLLFACIVLCACVLVSASSLSREEVDFTDGDHFRGISHLRTHQHEVSEDDPLSFTHTFDTIDDDGVQIQLKYEGTHHADLILIDKATNIVKFHCEADNSRLVLFSDSEAHIDSLIQRVWEERPIFHASHLWGAGCSSAKNGGVYLKSLPSVSAVKSFDTASGLFTVEYATEKSSFSEAFTELKMVFHTDDANGNKVSTFSSPLAVNHMTRFARLLSEEQEEEWTHKDNSELGIAAVGRTVAPNFDRQGVTASWNYEPATGGSASSSVSWYRSADNVVQVNCVQCFARLTAGLTITFDYSILSASATLTINSTQSARFKIQPQVIMNLNNLGSTTYKPANALFSYPLFGGNFQVAGVTFPLSLAFEVWPALTIQDASGQLQVQGGFMGSFRQWVSLQYTAGLLGGNIALTRGGKAPILGSIPIKLGGTISATIKPSVALQLHGSFMGEQVQAVLGIRPTLSARTTFAIAPQPADAICPSPWNLRTNISAYFDLISAYDVAINVAGFTYNRNAGGDVSFADPFWTSPSIPVYAGCPLNTLASTVMTFLTGSGQRLLDIDVPPAVVNQIPDFATIDIDVISAANLATATSQGFVNPATTLAGFLPSSSTFDLTPRDSLGNSLGSIQLPSAITFNLSFAQMGISANSLPSNVYLAYYDTTQNKWLSATSSCSGIGAQQATINPSTNSLQTISCHMTQYALTTTTPSVASASSAAEFPVIIVAAGAGGAIVLAVAIGVAVVVIRRRNAKKASISGHSPFANPFSAVPRAPSSNVSPGFGVELTSFGSPAAVPAPLAASRFSMPSHFGPPAAASRVPSPLGQPAAPPVPPAVPSFMHSSSASNVPVPSAVGPRTALAGGETATFGAPPPAFVSKSPIFGKSVPSNLFGQPKSRADVLKIPSPMFARPLEGGQPPHPAIYASSAAIEPAAPPPPPLYEGGQPIHPALVSS